MADFARGNPARWWRGRSIGAAHRSPASMFISPVRRYASLLSLVVLLLLIGAGWYFTNSKRVSRLSAALLSDVLGGPVTVESGYLSLSGTLLLSGVELRTGDASHGEALPLFSADQIEARFDWLSLLSGRLRATQLTAVRPRLSLIEDRATERWNYQMLGSKPAGGGGGSGTQPSSPVVVSAQRISLPVIVLRDAQVSWAEYDAGKTVETGRATVDGQLAPDVAVPTMYRFSMTQRGDEESGGRSGTSAVSGTWDVTSNRFSAVTTNVTLSDRMRRSMPRRIRVWWEEHALRGKLSQFRLTFDHEDGLTIGADLERVSMVYPVKLSADKEAHTLTFGNVRGTLTFGITKPFVRVAGLRGKVLGYDFVAEGDFRGFAPESPFDFSLKFPNAVVGDEYPAMAMAFPQSEELLRRLDAHGTMDLAINLKRISWNGRVFVDGSVNIKDGRMRFSHFPFPLKGLNGKVVFDQDKVEFRDLRAMAEENAVRISGVTGISKDDMSIDVTVSCDDAVLDDRAAACLAEKHAKVWDNFEVVVRGKLVCRVQREKLKTDPVTISVVVDITDAQGYYAALPYPVKHATGRVRLEGSDATLENLRLVVGGDGSGTVVVNGKVGYDDTQSAQALSHKLAIVAEVPIEQALVHALPDTMDRLTEGTKVSGRMGFSGMSEGQVGTEPEIRGSMTFREMELKAGGGIELQKLSADALLSPEKFEVKRLEAGYGEQLKFGAKGEVDFVAKRAKADLSARATGYVLPAEAPEILPEEARGMWKGYRPSGVLDGEMKASVELPTEGGKAGMGLEVKDYVAVVRPRGMSVNPEGWPEGLTDLWGTLTVSKKGVEMQQMTASSGGMALSWRGTYEPESGKLSGAASMTSKGLPEKWMKVLPEGAVTYLKQQKADAKIAMDISRLSTEGKGKNWDFAGSLRVDEFVSEGTWAFKAQEIFLTGKGVISPEWAVDFDGQLSGAKLAVSGRQIDTFTSRISAVSATKSLALTKMTGGVADGVLEGNFTMWLDKTPRYEATLTLADAPLSALLLQRNATEEEKKRIGTAKVTAQLSVQESFGEKSDRTGRGQLVVQDGTIYDVPLSLGLMQLVTLRLPVAGSFDRASMTYYLRDDKVTFERILLESEGINLAGMGTLTLGDQRLGFTFVTQTPKEIKLPILSELLAGARNQLLQLSVTGTVEHPKVVPVPLSAVTNTLQALLPKRKE